MARKRRRFGSSFKAKVALESVKEFRTISELAKKHKLHATQINLWKKQLVDGAEMIFEGDQNSSKGIKGISDEPDVAELYEQIGRLKVELEWLKKKVAQDGE
jgi:putative transposase